MNKKTPVSEIIKARLLASDAKFFANSNISKFVSKKEQAALVDEVSEKFEAVLRSLVIDIDNDHNTKETARRVARMYVEEIFAGRYEAKPKVTSFPNATYDQLYITGPITVRSLCAHHFMPIQGKAYIGVFPGENVIGLSKFNRILEWMAARPQIQEELTTQLANEIAQETNAKGVAVVLQAEHGCLTMRGVREHESDMTTSVMLGEFRESEKLKHEFLTLLQKMK
jgi:GTP cyclohydrolase IA